MDRLSRHLDKGTPAEAAASYLQQIKKWVPAEPVIYIDDSDVVKPDGYKFESLGIVRDGSESTSTKNVYKKGYHVTEACVLTTSNHPVSIFSKIHSSTEKDYKSANTITFEAMEQGAALFEKATFCMDRGYDDNKMFLKLDALKQNYVIRLKSNRKLLYHNKWTFATELRNRRKGKIKTNVFYKGKNHEAYISHVKVQITASRKDIYLVLVYGITEHPMMLATNKEIKSKEDVIKVARTYFSRWKIEEYFRCKKQMFQFENSVYESFAQSTHLTLYHFMHGISGNDFNVIRNKCIKGFHHKISRSYKGKSVLLLLSAGERHPWHTIACRGRCQTLVPDKTSGIPSTLP